MADVGIAVDSDVARRKSAADSHYEGVSTVINRDTIREWQAIQDAERRTGITGKTTSGAIYRAALKQMGMDAADLPGPAAKAMYDALRNRPARKVAMATDSTTASCRAAMFPNGNRLNQGY
jgi:hypothetical protein